MILTLTTQRAYLQAISGMFASKQHPGGLTPKELDVLVTLLFVVGKEDLITKEVKEKVSSLTSHPIQVITNYVKRLRDKGAITKDNRLHKLIRASEVTIKYKEQNNV